MDLLIDIGNSRIKWALYDLQEDRFARSGDILYGNADLAKIFSGQWSDLTRPDKVLIANVAGSHLASTLNTWIEKNWQIKAEYVKTATFSHGVKNAYPDHSALGIDRWMAVIAAWHRLREHKKAICVVDCGTATTIDGISEYGQHIGGIILPGYMMMQEALVNHTLGINMVSKTTPMYNFCNNTEQGISSGCCIATVATINQLVKLMENDYGEGIKCIITGGNAVFIIKQLSRPFEYEPKLVLHGIAISSRAIP